LVNQILSLTGFSFVGGPGDERQRSRLRYLKHLNRPLRSGVSLEAQRIED
jgi:hypothetical protein